MKRRALLTSGVTLAASSTIAAPAIATGKKELKMVTSWPKNFPGLGTSAERFAKMLSDATDGQYTVKVFSAGELVSALECHDAVQEGTADMYHSAEYYYVGKMKSYAFFTSVPFGMTPDEQNAWLYYGGGQDLWDEVAAQFNIKPFAAGNSGPQMGGWFKNPINSLEDIKGMKMRTPGLGGEIFKKLGGVPVTLAGGDILPALQSGTIDAAEWVGPWNDLAFGLHKVAKNYYFPGFQEPAAWLSVGLNKDVWDEMPANIQTIVKEIARSCESDNLAEFNANNAAALQTLINKHDVNVLQYSDDIAKAIGQASKEILSEVAESSELDKKVVDSYFDFRNKIKKWSAISTQAFENQRDLYPFE